MISWLIAVRSEFSWALSSLSKIINNSATEEFGFFPAASSDTILVGFLRSEIAAMKDFEREIGGWEDLSYKYFGVEIDKIPSLHVVHALDLWHMQLHEFPL